MRRKLYEILAILATGTVLVNPPLSPEPEPEPEVIELPWDFGETIAEEVQTVYNTELIERVVMGEAGTEPYIGQVAVAATILNRCEAWGKTTEEVIYQKNQYYTGYSGEISESVKKAVAEAVSNRELFPADMYYFRTGHYHTFGTPYTVIGAHYFSRE